MARVAPNAAASRLVPSRIVRLLLEEKTKSVENRLEEELRSFCFFLCRSLVVSVFEPHPSHAFLTRRPMAARMIPTTQDAGQRFILPVFHLSGLFIE